MLLLCKIIVRIALLTPPPSLLIPPSLIGPPLLNSQSLSSHRLFNMASRFVLLTRPDLLAKKFAENYLRQSVDFEADIFH